MYLKNLFTKRTRPFHLKLTSLLILIALLTGSISGAGPLTVLASGPEQYDLPIESVDPASSSNASAGDIHNSENDSQYNKESNPSGEEDELIETVEVETVVGSGDTGDAAVNAGAAGAKEGTNAAVATGDQDVINTAASPETVVGSGDTGTSVDDTRDNAQAVRDLAERLCKANVSGRRTGMFTWDSEKKDRSWTYYNGIMMDAFLMLDEEVYTGYVNAFYNANVASTGKVDSTGSSQNYYRENELDSIPPTRALFDLLRSESVSEQDKTKYRKMIDYVYSVMQKYDVVEGTDGNFIHKMNNSNWTTYQIALDGLYMAQPFFMEVANALDDGTLTPDDFATYTVAGSSSGVTAGPSSGATPGWAPIIISGTPIREDEAEVPVEDAAPTSGEIYSSVVSRMLWIGNNLYDSDTGLYNHGWGPDAGLNGQFWLRAVGWYAAALADVISMMPDDYEAGREALCAIEKQLFDGMRNYQDEATGMWYNVINEDATLMGSVDNMPESSGSALLAYAMMKSYTEGYLDDVYGEAGLRAFNGTVMKYLSSDGLGGVYKSSGVETEAAGYLTKTYETNEAKGVGPLMMAAAFAEEAAEILNGEPGPIVVEPENPPVEPTGPSFKTNSLFLGGRIGVNFYLEMPGDFSDYADSYMTFSVCGEETTAQPDPNFMNSENTYYGFTCYVNSLQMADEITAVFHYGEEGSETVEDTYSVLAYLDNIKENEEEFDETIRTLGIAMADYGYYAQQYLSRIKGYNLEDEHEEMPDPSVTSFDFAEIAEGMEQYKYIEEKAAGSEVAKAGCTLSLESGTILRVFLYMKEGFAGTPSVTLDGNAVEAQKVSDSVYCIAIDDIPAQELGEMHEIIVSNGGDYKVQLSALSYPYMVMSTESMAEDAKCAMAAFCRYYSASMAYSAAPG